MRRINHFPSQEARTYLRALGLLSAASVLALPSTAEAKTVEKVLYNFCSQNNCADGGSPAGALIEGQDGSLYGTTQVDGANGWGVVFKLTPNGNGTYSDSTLYSFCSVNNCADGAFPDGSGVIADSDGNLYGTTIFGGSGNCSTRIGAGCGTVFELVNNSGSYSFRQLYSFAGASDGAYPLAGVTADEAGTVYGTASARGQGNCRLDQGNGFASTGCGTVFKLVPNGDGTYSYSTLYLFNGGSDGANPTATPIVDRKGNVYGTTLAGGTGGCTLFSTTGCGTVFKVAPSGKEKELYAFLGGNDGANPADWGGLLRDKSGDIYGTTFAGGAANQGTVFKLTSGAGEAVLYSFCSKDNCSDGATPFSGVIADKAGNLYGTTSSGGTGGVVFELGPDGTETTLYSFCSQTNCTDGFFPEAKPIADRRFKHLYGTTLQDGAYGAGLVYRINLENAGAR